MPHTTPKERKRKGLLKTARKVRNDSFLDGRPISVANPIEQTKMKRAVWYLRPYIVAVILTQQLILNQEG